jgi:DNA-binding transcriptional regulator YdaS (Cro superfamily)
MSELLTDSVVLQGDRDRLDSLTSEPRRGAVMLYDGMDEPTLCVVAAVSPGLGTAQVATTDLTSAEVSMQTVYQDQLSPPPDALTTDQWVQVQLALVKVAGDLNEELDRLQRTYTALSNRAQEADDKIAAMRAYAIERHQRGDICRGGLNDFLVAHELEPYQPRYSATVSLTVDVEVETDEDPEDVLRYGLNVSADDDDEISITSEPAVSVESTQLLTDTD